MLPMRFYHLQYVQDGVRLGICWVGDESTARKAIAHWSDEQNSAFTYEAVDIEATKEGILNALNRFGAKQHYATHAAKRESSVLAIAFQWGEHTVKRPGSQREQRQQLKLPVVVITNELSGPSPGTPMWEYVQSGDSPERAQVINRPNRYSASAHAVVLWRLRTDPDS